MEQPTEDGKYRYPNADGYYIANEDRVPCTCDAFCPRPCKGECGCEACNQSWNDFGYDD